MAQIYNIFAPPQNLTNKIDTGQCLLLSHLQRQLAGKNSYVMPEIIFTISVKCYADTLRNFKIELVSVPLLGQRPEVRNSRRERCVIPLKSCRFTIGVIEMTYFG